MFRIFFMKDKVFSNAEFSNYYSAVDYCKEQGKDAFIYEGEKIIAEYYFYKGCYLV